MWADKSFKIGGKRYFFLIVDDFPIIMWVSMLKIKSNAFHNFKKLKILDEAEKGEVIRCLRTNQGDEFLS